MKVEYTLYGKDIALIVQAKQFKLAQQLEQERDLLAFAIDSFCNVYGCDSHFNERVNNTILRKLSDGGEVIYLLQHRWLGDRIANSWCEVIVQNAGRPDFVVFSENYGRDFILKDEQQ